MGWGGCLLYLFAFVASLEASVTRDMFNPRDHLPRFARLKSSVQPKFGLAYLGRDLHAVGVEEDLGLGRLGRLFVLDLRLH